MFSLAKAQLVPVLLLPLLVFFTNNKIKVRCIDGSTAKMIAIYMKSNTISHQICRHNKRQHLAELHTSKHIILYILDR